LARPQNFIAIPSRSTFFQKNLWADLNVSPSAYTKKRVGTPAPSGFAAIKAIALNAAISGSIFAVPEGLSSDDDGVAVGFDPGIADRPGHQPLASMMKRSVR
jgi:hypothetical protein